MSITFNYLLSMERYPNTVEVHGFHLGTDERVARGIIAEKMRTCRENDWPMVTMALMQNGGVVDTLYRDGKWHSQVEAERDY
jgi:hypothetical protein